MKSNKEIVEEFKKTFPAIAEVLENTSTVFGFNIMTPIEAWLELKLEQKDKEWMHEAIKILESLNEECGEYSKESNCPCCPTLCTSDFIESEIAHLKSMLRNWFHKPRMFTVKDIASRYMVSESTANQYINMSIFWRSEYTRKERGKILIDQSGLGQLDDLTESRRARGWSNRKYNREK